MATRRFATSRRSWAWLSSATALAIACLPAHASAREGPSSRIDIDATTLAAAIAELSREAGVSIGTEGALPQLATPAIHGRMSVERALERLLVGSGFVAHKVGSRAWRIERAPSHGVAQAPGASSAVPVVTAAEPPAPIIVTASKRAFELQSLPMAVSVTSFDISTRTASATTGSSDVAEQSEGLSLTGLGPGRNRIFLRGIADSAFNGPTQSTVAVVLDDARLTYSAPDPDIRLVDVERIELLKGPQGSLYGTGALGGIYHIVSRSPDLVDPSLEVSAGASWVQQGSPGWSSALVANLPLRRDRAALRLIGYAAREGGWVDSGARGDGNSNQVFGGRAALAGDLGGGWLIEGKGLIQLLDSNDSQYVYAEGARQRPAQLPEPHDNDLRHAALRLSRDSGPLQMVISTGLTSHEVRDTIDATIGANQFGLPDPGTLDEDRHYRVWDSEARIFNHDGRIDWLVGLSHVTARQSLLSVLSNAAGSAGLEVDDSRRRVTDSAVFGDTTFPVFDRVKLNLGARLFSSVTRESRSFAQASFTEKRTKQGVTPTVAIAWQPRETRLVYLRYGSAFRPGGANVDESGQLRALKSDELATIEAGWREQTTDGASFEVDAYFSRWQHIQSDRLRPDGLIESGTAGNGQIFGAEASAQIPLGHGWRSILGANYTRATLTSALPGFDSDDRRLPVVPEYTARASLVRQFDLAGAPAHMELRLRYLGPARLSFDPALDRPMGRVLESSLRAGVTIGGVAMDLVADNLFDNSSDTFAYGNPLRFPLGRQFTPQRPRTVSLSIGRRF